MVILLQTLCKLSMLFNCNILTLLPNSWCTGPTWWIVGNHITAILDGYTVPRNSWTDIMVWSSWSIISHHTGRWVLSCNIMILINWRTRLAIRRNRVAVNWIVRICHSLSIPLASICTPLDPRLLVWCHWLMVHGDRILVLNSLSCCWWPKTCLEEILKYCSQKKQKDVHRKVYTL